MSANLSNKPQRVLVTGSAGVIGQAAAIELKNNGHFVRGLDVNPTENVDESITGDIADTQTVFDACAGMTAVVHMAAFPNNADFLDVLLRPNVIGLYNILEASKTHEIKRLVMASSAQVIQRLDRRKTEGMIRPEDGVAPGNHYALTKVWMEEAGRMYAREYGMSILAIRIGWTPRKPREIGRIDASDHAKSIYLSRHDGGVFFRHCVEAELDGFHVLYAASRSPVAFQEFDPEPAKTLIGYEPRDAWPEGLPKHLAEAFDEQPESD